eukprot:TRINITY_DN31382_c0_g1_i1.p1 TRINITY_DN31382_c0_g1~~TRINITY_DN31382_c0_g1_i1.p1  ORF type:complete len:320 (+),score=61.25 TRINITY_DN31382_c0_g1_i1:52-960(+)
MVVSFARSRALLRLKTQLRRIGTASFEQRPYNLPPWMKGRPGRNDEAVHLLAEASGGKPVVLEPGLVVLRNALDRTQQVELAKAAWMIGSGEWKTDHCFFEDDGSLRGPKGSRGRVFDACSNFPPLLSEVLVSHCSEWVERARLADAAMPKHKASHLLLLYYRECGTLGFHRDEQANDGTGDEPVVNLSLGSEMDFAVRHEHSEVARVVTLQSGDVILFGGPCRKILHAVLDTKAVAESVLPLEAGTGRLSFTLRHAPEVLGFEHLYADFRPQLEDPKQKVTGDELLLGQEEAAKRLHKMKH